MYRLPKFFCPNSKTKLVRLGKANDGGYSIPEKTLEDAKILFSFGLDDDWSFEEDFKKKTGAKIICFDNSVNYKFWIKRFIKDLIYFNFKQNYYEQFKNCDAWQRIYNYMPIWVEFLKLGINYKKKNKLSSHFIQSPCFFSYKFY